MTDVFTPSGAEPTTIMVGDYYTWTVPEDYDSGAYVLSYLAVQGVVTQTLTGTVVNNLWTFVADSAVTSMFTQGRVTFDLRVTRISDGARVTLRSFTVDFFSTSADRRSHARLMIDKIESILTGRADNDVESYTIKSRSITKMSVKELTEWREYYLAELGREPDPITGERKNKNTVKVGFI